MRAYPGHVEVSQKGYRENRTLDYAMSLEPAQVAVLSDDEARSMARRLEALLQSELTNEFKARLKRSRYRLQTY